MCPSPEQEAHSPVRLLLSLQELAHSVTGLWNGRYVVRIPVGARDFSSFSPKHADRIRGVRRPGREFCNSPPCSAEVKNEWSYTSAPPTLYAVMVVTGTVLPLTRSGRIVHWRHSSTNSCVLFVISEFVRPSAKCDNVANGCREMCVIVHSSL